MITIQSFEKRDWAATWQIIEPVFRVGETYAFSPDITEEEAYTVWVEMPAATFVAVYENNGVLGAYYIKPNQPAPGSHVCNCGYIVAVKARGKGIATKMKYRYLGSSELLMSRITLETMTFGARDWGCDEKESQAIIKKYLDAGGQLPGCCRYLCRRTIRGDREKPHA
jgi:hypothetical protein